jgi:hypothetical protein
MITREELNEKLKMDLSGITDTAQVVGVLLDHIKYSSERYAELNGEARKMVDRQIALITEMNKTVIDDVKSQPDNQKNRKIIRLHRLAEGSHFEVSDLLSQLEGNRITEAPITTEARELFILVSQIAYNFLCDITDKTLRGGGGAAIKLGLLYCALDEALAAFHLAARSYAPQSLAHTRNITQILDLISIFEKDVKYIDYWSSDDHKERQKVYPKEIRKILGKTDLEENQYWTLSDLGSHPSFKYVQTKMSVRSDKARTQFKINVGGSAGKSHTQQALIVCILETFKIALMIDELFSDKLLTEETEPVLNNAQEHIDNFLTKH